MLSERPYLGIMYNCDLALFRNFVNESVCPVSEPRSWLDPRVLASSLRGAPSLRDMAVRVLAVNRMMQLAT